MHLDTSWPKSFPVHVVRTVPCGAVRSASSSGTPVGAAAAVCALLVEWEVGVDLGALVSSGVAPAWGRCCRDDDGMCVGTSLLPLWWVWRSRVEEACGPASALWVVWCPAAVAL